MTVSIASRTFRVAMAHSSERTLPKCSSIANRTFSASSESMPRSAKVVVRVRLSTRTSFLTLRTRQSTSCSMSPLIIVSRSRGSSMTVETPHHRGSESGPGFTVDGHDEHVAPPAVPEHVLPEPALVDKELSEAASKAVVAVLAGVHVDLPKRPGAERVMEPDQHAFGDESGALRVGNAERGDVRESIPEVRRGDR